MVCRNAFGLGGRAGLCHEACSANEGAGLGGVFLRSKGSVSAVVGGILSREQRRYVVERRGSSGSLSCIGK